MRAGMSRRHGARRGCTRKPSSLDSIPVVHGLPGLPCGSNCNPMVLPSVAAAQCGPRRPGIPILMYHSISQGGEAGRNSYFRTRTDPRVFSKHVAFLAANGYRTIGLGEAVRQNEATTPNAEKAVVLTFDDGFEDFYTEAFPILSTFGYTATVFLPTAYIGAVPRRFNGTMCLTWSQVRELQKAGWSSDPTRSRIPNSKCCRPTPSGRRSVARAGDGRQVGHRCQVLLLSICVSRVGHRVQTGASGHAQRGGIPERRFDDHRQGEPPQRPILPGAATSELRRRTPPLPGKTWTGGYDWLHTLQVASKAWRANGLLPAGPHK